MNQEEILQKIASIREELTRDQYRLLQQKIMERRLHLHKSARKSLMRKLIEKLRAKLMSEVELILGPVLDNQQEINLRFLEEIERLKQSVLSGEACDASGQMHETPDDAVSKDGEG
jgi:hypothetical protein